MSLIAASASSIGLDRVCGGIIQNVKELFSDWCLMSGSGGGEPSTVGPFVRDRLRGTAIMSRRRFPTVRSRIDPLSGAGLSRPSASLTPERRSGFGFGLTWQRLFFVEDGGERLDGRFEFQVYLILLEPALFLVLDLLVCGGELLLKLGDVQVALVAELVVLVCSDELVLLEDEE